MVSLEKAVNSTYKMLILGLSLVGVSGGLILANTVNEYLYENQRPSEYRKVSITESNNVKGYIKTSGKGIGKLTHKYGGIKLNITLEKDGNSIECKSNELSRDFSLPISANQVSTNNVIEAYTALIRNETKNEEITVKGRANNGRLDMYEIEIGNKNYVLLER